jgi:hypothetical protein
VTANSPKPQRALPVPAPKLPSKLKFRTNDGEQSDPASGRHDSNDQAASPTHLSCPNENGRGRRLDYGGGPLIAPRRQWGSAKPRECNTVAEQSDRTLTRPHNSIVGCPLRGTTGSGRHAVRRARLTHCFGFCETPEVLIALTRWVRLRLRAALWRQWKTPRRRRAALIANGVSEWAARNTAGSGRGPWYLARSRALSTGLSNAHFKSLGLPSLFQSC